MTNKNGYFLDSNDKALGACFVLTGPWRNEYSALMQLMGISALRLSSGAGWQDTDISFVSDLHFLTGIEVYSWRVKDVTPIFGIAGLRYVGLQSEFTSVARFDALIKLETCKLVWRPKVTGLEQCSKLRHVNIDNYPESDLTQLSSLSLLQRLQVSSKKLSSLQGVQLMPSLRDIDVFDCPRLQDVSWLTGCVSLRSMEFESCRKMAKIPEDLKSNCLETVELVDCGEVVSLAPLQNCINLTKLRFVGDTRIIDGDFQWMVEHQNLRNVWFANRLNYTFSREALDRQLQAKSTKKISN